MKRLTRNTLSLLCGLGLTQGVVAAVPFTFDSGSSGADGDLILSCAVEGIETVIDVGASGVMNYNSINIGSGCILKFSPTGNGPGHKSNPVRLLVSGDVVIEGTIDLTGTNGNVGISNYSVVGGIGGPGGYNGGNSGMAWLSSQAGYGPGGGAGVNVSATGNCGNAGSAGTFTPVIHEPRLQPLVGGSGGGGGCHDNGHYSVSSGAGGGGALLIAATGSITLNGTISTAGGYTSGNAAGGSGSAGMIHLIANAVDGSGSVNAIKTIIESNNGTTTLSSVFGLRYDYGLERLTLDLAQTPSLTIATVGGVDTSTTNQVELGASGSTTIAVSSSGIPEGAEVTLSVSGNLVARTTATGLLDANGDTSMVISIPSGISVITAYVSQSVTNVASLPSYLNEQITVARLEVTPGAKSALRFYTASGKPVPDGLVKDPWSHVSFNQG